LPGTFLLPFYQYRFLGMKSETARYFFIVLAVSLHAVFLGAARL
jgi:hypothetical protein